jgi:EAL domain-containing protein (putative c-di-GMP-specific phosphodiesterase class I)
MSYLRRFPIDKLKIDKTFVAEMDTRPDDASIVQAIISLAHGLGLKVVAEGVETQAQLDALRSLGCDQYQGYYFSPALPPGEFAALVNGLGDDSTDADFDPVATLSKLTAVNRILKVRG